MEKRVILAKTLNGSYFPQVSKLTAPALLLDHHA